MIDLFKIITTKDKMGDIYIAVPAAKSTKQKWAFATINQRMRMSSRFVKKGSIDFLFGPYKRYDLKTNKGKNLFFDAVFIKHNYNSLADWAPIIDSIDRGE